MHHQRFLSLLRRILSTPTAPFHEYHVAALIRELLGSLPRTSVESDDYGNLVARYRRGRSRPLLAFGAHMDHPGWVKRRGRAKFLGWVPQERLDSHPVEWFGSFGMWQLTPFAHEGDRIISRACDDLVGCAAIVALLSELERRGEEADVFGIFTRAEEVGFHGAAALAQNWPLPEGVRFVSLETSEARGSARMGEGPVIRVGDRASVFDDAVTAELVDAARAAKVSFQRCLLDGGSCEATAMNLYGIPAAGISVILANYHNIAADEGMAEEYISLQDAKNLVKIILTAVLRTAAKDRESSKDALRARIEKRIADHEPYRIDAEPCWEKATHGAA